MKFSLRKQESSAYKYPGLLDTRTVNSATVDDLLTFFSNSLSSQLVLLSLNSQSLKCLSITG